jgi:ornithine cyclodeaminase/alanine dehydrogenase-like protein (mu-crystallin family)
VAAVSIERAIAAVERALVDHAAGRRGERIPYASGGALWDLAAATCGAIASRFLAVGTPRTMGLVGDGELAARCLDAHAHWFAPQEIRRGTAADPRAACAADIVCVCDDAAVIDPTWLRNGTHVNLLRGSLDRARLPRAVVADMTALAAMVAGRIDGRQLDELTLFAPGGPGEYSVAELAIVRAVSSQ